MTARIFDWPANLIPADVTILPPRKTVGLTTSLSDATQRTPSIRPPFGMVLDFPTLFGSDVLAWRAALGLFEGRTNIARIPLFDMWFRASDAQIGAGTAPHSDGATFSDGALYLTDDLEGVTVTGTQGDGTITADFGSYGPLLEAGLYFGLGEWPYLATQVWWEGTVATIRCTPTLRLSVVAEPLKLKPTMLVGLTDDDNGQLTLKRGRFGGPSIELVERFDVLLS